MLSPYIEAGMCLAHYESLDDEGYYGEIPQCRGVFANAATLEACRDQLAEVLEDWIFFRISRNLDLPKRDRSRGSP